MKLNRTQLKLLAIICMLLDHVAYAFLSYQTLLYQIMRFFGRITAPVMCFMLVEGYMHTANFSKYCLRMFIFAMLAYFPYIYLVYPGMMVNHEIGFVRDYNMLFTLLICLYLIFAIDKIGSFEASKGQYYLTVFLLILVAILLSLPCDWFIFAPLFTANFYMNRNNEKRRDIITAVICTALFVYMSYQMILGGFPFNEAIVYNLYSLGAFMTIPLIRAYNHKNGRWDMKYFFYAYYPLHLLIIDIVKYLRMR